MPSAISIMGFILSFMSSRVLTSFRSSALPSNQNSLVSPLAGIITRSSIGRSVLFFWSQSLSCICMAFLCQSGAPARSIVSMSVFLFILLFTYLFAS
jgi:hypothetical protein